MKYIPGDVVDTFSCRIVVGISSQFDSLLLLAHDNRHTDHNAADDLNRTLFGLLVCQVVTSDCRRGGHFNNYNHVRLGVITVRNILVYCLNCYLAQAETDDFRHQMKPSNQSIGFSGERRLPP